MLRHLRAEANPGTHSRCDHIWSGIPADWHPTGWRPGSDGAACSRPASCLQGASWTVLARSVVGASTTMRPRSPKSHPSGPCGRPGGIRHRQTVQEGVRKAARVLEDAGYAVEEVEPPSIDVAARTLLDMLNTPDIRAGWQTMSHIMPADTRRFISAFYAVAGDPDPVTAMQCFMIRHSLLRAWGEFQQTHPLIVAPIYTGVPFAASTDLDDGHVAETIRGMRMTLAVNALGLPAVTVPVGIEDGLPQVVQVIGPRYREDLCLDAAAAIEERLGIITPIDPR